jgi:hypothetical protein
MAIRARNVDFCAFLWYKQEQIPTSPNTTTLNVHFHDFSPNKATFSVGEPLLGVD